jgi:hypothetical protein
MAWFAELADQQARYAAATLLAAANLMFRMPVYVTAGAATVVGRSAQRLSGRIDPGWDP